MFERYAIFYTPPTGALADFGANWLGWDNCAGGAREHPHVEGMNIAHITTAPRKYGLHGTLKAPFRLSGAFDELEKVAAQFAKTHAPTELERMTLSAAHGFVALRPMGNIAALRALASDIVRVFDAFRTTMTAADIARRREHKLSRRQDQHMLDWGYPFIFDDFNFHMTLSGAVSARESAVIVATLAPIVTPLIQRPMMLDAITLMGQDRAGMFHQLHRYALTG
jgi:hypothetical protein